MQGNSQLYELMLNAAKDALDGGFCFIFAGPVPTSPNAALDMGSQHTQCARISLDGGGTGLTFADAVGAVLSKLGSEDWEGAIAFDGAEDGETTLTPTFFRFCQAADTGRGAGTTPRLQGTVGGQQSTATMKLQSDTLTNGDGGGTRAAQFNVRLASIG